jgi:hypothetical protein
MTRRTLISFLLAATVLSACSHGSETRPGMIQPVNNNAQFEDAVALLVDGEVTAARKMLSAMARRDPADQRTAALFATLDADPAAVLGTRSFNYRVQAGDQMTALSQRFLSDRLKFFLLSRYNGITVPKAIVVGQILRIPGVAPVIAPPPRGVRPTLHEPMRKPAAVTSKPPVDHAPSTAAIHRAVQLRGAGLAALNTGNVNRAVMLMRQAAALDRNSPAIKNDLARAIRIQATVAARQ